MNVHKSKSEGFKISNIIDNIKRARLAAVLLILIVVISALLNYCAFSLLIKNSLLLISYLVMYTIIIILSLVFLFLTKGIKAYKYKNESYLKNMELLCVAYITIIMTWGSILSLIGQLVYGQLIVFMVLMVACSVFFYLESKKMLMPYLLSVFVLSLGLPYVQSDNKILFGHYINLFGFSVISFISSRLIYRKYLKEYNRKVLLQKSNALLKNQIELNKLINSQLEKANLQLEKLSLIDELTSMANRRGFNNYIDKMFDLYKYTDFLFSIIIMDIDSFKQFNDTYGHNEGDNVLKQVADKIKSSVLHPLDFVTRWGGEEFIYASFDANIEEAEQIAETIRENILSLKIVNKFSETGFITASFGVSTMKLSNKGDVIRCIEQADRALYKAKTSGKNCIEKYCGYL